MPRFVPATQPTNVGTAGVKVTVPVPAGNHHIPLDRIKVLHTGGDATAFDVEISSDPNIADVPGADQLKCIARYEGVTKVDDQGDFSWGPSDMANIYVFIKPNAGSNNNFLIALFIDGGE